MKRYAINNTNADTAKFKRTAVKIKKINLGTRNKRGGRCL